MSGVITVVGLIRYKSLLHYYFCQRVYRYRQKQKIFCHNQYSINIPLIKVHLDFAYKVWNRLKAQSLKKMISQKNIGDRWLINFYTHKK